MSTSDEDLLKRARDGDKDALTELLLRHSPAVRKSLASEIPFRWRGVLSGDDLLQDAYVDAFLNVCKFRANGGDSFREWLITLGQRRLMNAIRKLKGH